MAITIDFETESIQARPLYPPRPVGVAIKYPGKRARYYAFGHPTENNCTFGQAKAALLAAWSSNNPLLFHNARFDIDVAETHFGMPRLPWQRYYDTMLELFLFNPHLKSFGLKPASEELLNMPPDEANELKDWLVANGHCTRASKSWGALISKTPGELCGKYAIGDVERTEALHDKLYPTLKSRSMLPAYDRERELMLILLDNERHGIRVDLPRLTEDVTLYSEARTKLVAWLRKQLGNSVLNLDSGTELLAALETAGHIDKSKLGVTPSGLLRPAKEALTAAVTEPRLVAGLNYYASISTCLGTFMTPWLEQARATGGRIHTSWSQIKNMERGKPTGAVTGRLSSSPNFQNVPKEFPNYWKGLKPPFKVPALPKIRSYIIPDEGHVLVDLDYSQQELRILAHYAEGALLEAYLDNPRLDLHEVVRAKLSEKLGRVLKKDQVKPVNFGLIYGMGVALMGRKANVPADEARAIKAGVLAMFPGIADITECMRDKAATGQPLRTWGGREYHCEAPEVINGEVRTKEYKMLNVLIQGSAADCTKEAVIRYAQQRPNSHQLLLTVHDEILISVPTNERELGMEKLKQAMESVEFDVPMLTAGNYTDQNWAVLK